MKVLKFTSLAAAAILAVPMVGLGQDGAGYGPGLGYGMPPGSPYAMPQQVAPADAWSGYPAAAYPSAPAIAPTQYPASHGPEAGMPMYGDPAAYGQPCTDGSLAGAYDGGIAGGYGAPPVQNFWVTAEYLSWRAKGNDLPALLTTSPIGTPQEDAGMLGSPTTSVVFGETGIDDEYRSGARIALGFWATEGEYTGYEVEYLALTDAGTDFTDREVFSDGTGNQILARPFFNVQTRMQDTVLLAFPNFIPDIGPPADLDGDFSVESNTSTESLAVTRRDLLWMDNAIGYRSYFLVGYRYFNLDEDLRIRDRITPVGGLFVPGSFIDSTDEFDTMNDFHGLELGVHTQYNRGQWTWDVLTKLAMGNSHEVVNIRGETIIFNGFVEEDFNGGTLTAPTNIGRFSQNEFALMPEFGINLAYQFTPNLKFTVGYSFIYYSHVMRTGDQIDLALNPSQFDGGTLVGEARPQPTLEDTDYFLYGGNAGIEWRW